MSGRERYLPDRGFWCGGDERARALHKANALIAESHELHNRGRFDREIEACRRAVALRPDRPEFHDELACALTRRYKYYFNPDLCEELRVNGDLDEAILEWRQAISLGWGDQEVYRSLTHGPVNASSHLCIGHALTSTGDYEEAAKHLRIATDIQTRTHFPEHWATYGDSGKPRGPDFVIIGGTKCGTTSLYEYLKDHPQVLPTIWKEIEFYRFPDRGIEWYLSQFPRIPDTRRRFLSGEASTCYIGMPSVKQRLFKHYPNVKLIALVRDPVDKAISHAHHDRKLGVEHRTVEEAITQELDILESLDSLWPPPEDYWKTQRGYVWHGLYANPIADWVSTFPKESMLVIPSEDLYAKPAETVARVYAHLGLPDHQLANYEVHLQGSYEKGLPSRLRERLMRFFAPHNARLEEMIGRRLQWQAPARSTPRVNVRAARVMREVHVQ